MSLGGGGSGRSNGPKKKPVTLRVQSSVEGKAIPVGWGQNRQAGNLIWYGDFKNHGGSGSGGKGGGGGGKGKSNQPKYDVAVVIALCEGPVSAVLRVWNDQSLSTFAKLNLTTFLGTYSQTPWGYLTTNHPNDALAYRGIAYMAAGKIKLGSSPALPNLTFEVLYGINTGIPGQPDALPKDILVDFLTNQYYGGFLQAGDLDAWTTYNNYCKALGLVLSPVLTDHAEASAFVQEMLDITNSDIFLSDGVFKIVPYGDENVTGNGATYTAPVAPLFNLGIGDFQLDNQGATSGSGAVEPVQGVRRNPLDRNTVVSVEYLSRANDYNAKIVEAPDSAAIFDLGIKKADPKQHHAICIESVAVTVAHLQLGKESRNNEYQFTLGAEYIMLEPMDIVSLTYAPASLNNAWVRIIEITENDDHTLSMVAEEYLNGTGSRPQYATEFSTGFIPAFEANPGSVNTPIIWEPTYNLTNGDLEMWIAVAGTAPDWFGCEVWMSTDNESYTKLDVFEGQSQYGTLIAALPSYPPTNTGVTLDNTNTLSVNINSSQDNTLDAGTLADALAGNTLCYVDGEYIAYSSAVLVVDGVYNITGLDRGLQGSTSSAHALGTAFVRLNQNSVFKQSFTGDRIGDTVWFKFLSYNNYRGGLQDISTVTAYPYTIKGSAVSAGVASVQNLRSNLIAGSMYLSWDEVSDFRGVRYQIRVGSAWDSAAIVGDVAHPPFRITQGGTYWVAAYVHPHPDVTVYQNPAVDLVLTDVNLVSNVVATYDEAASGWPGTISGNMVVQSGSLVLGGSGDITSVADVTTISDFVYYGGVGSGYYTSTHIIDAGKVAYCNVSATYAYVGQNPYQNILSFTDWLNTPDILGIGATANVSVAVQISTSLDGTTFSAWQPFVAGQYYARAFQLRLYIQSLDGLTTAIVSGFKWSVDVPDRVDRYNNISVAAGGTNITFRLDSNLATPVPFLGGNAGAAVPHVVGSILGAQTGDILLITNITLSGCTIQVTNGGVGVARTVNLLVQGY